jgi:hypothetical protein
MDPAMLAEVKAAVEMSMKGDPQSVMTADKLLGETLPARDGYTPSLLALSVDASVDASVRKAASILLGKEIKNGWKKILENMREIPESDKKTIRESYFEAMVRCNDQSIIRLLGHGLYSILVREVNTWTTFEDSVHQLLTVNPTHERIYCALVCLHALAKVKQYYVNEDRVSVSATSKRFLPVLLELGITLSKDFNQVNALLTKEIIKIFFRIVRIDIDDYLRTIEINDAWMNYMDDIFVKSVHSLKALQDAKTDEHTYSTSPYWGVMKWIVKAIKRYAFRYGNPDHENEQYEAFATHWMGKYAEGYWVKITEILNNRKHIKVPEKIIVVMISILFNLVDSDTVLQKYENTIEGLLLDTMLDIIKFTKEEEQLYNDNPVEYFRKNDENNMNFGPAGQALQVFGKSLKRKKYLKAFMKFVNSCLQDKVNPRTKQPINVIDIEAFFHVIETHSIYVVKIKNCSELVAGLLQNFVLPELQSAHGFMRMRACKMVCSYASSTLDLELLKSLADGVVKCIKDKDLPVRSCAAQALETLLKKNELRDYFLPELKQLLTTYVHLINEFENDSLIASLKSIFEMYSEVIGPYALDLVNNLSELFFKLLEKEEKIQDGDDDDSAKDKEVIESGFACQGCLTAIEEILRSNLDKSLLPKLYTSCEPIFEYVFSEKGLDFLGEAAGILNMFVYNFDAPLPEGLWAYFVIICYSMKGKPTGKKPDFPAYFAPKLREIFNNMMEDDWATEFLSDLSQILRNFINKGEPFLFTGVDCYGEKLVPLLFSVVMHLVEKNIDYDYTSNEITDCLTLLGYLISQFPAGEHVNACTPKVLDITIQTVSGTKKPSQNIKDIFIHNLGCCLACNPLLTLEHLNSKDLLSTVLANWPEQHKKACSYRAKKASFLGMLSLFSLKVEQLQQAKIPVIALYKTMVEDLPYLSKQQQRILDAEFEDSENEDELLALGHEDEEDMLDVDLDEPDHPADHHHHHNKKKLDQKIKRAHKEIDKLKENEDMEREEAREAFGEIEDKVFCDASDKINEVLIFETTLTSRFLITKIFSPPTQFSSRKSKELLPLSSDRSSLRMLRRLRT